MVTGVSEMVVEERGAVQELLLIFAKAPQPGQVKTRLTPYLSPEEAAAVHTASLTEVWRRHRPSEEGERARWLFSQGESPLWEQLDWRAGEQRLAQEGAQLGARLARAAQQAFAISTVRRICFLGADSPTLPPRFVDEAFLRLQRERVVFGPALDGGYYLLGLQRDALELSALLFEDISWGSERVLSESVERLQRAGERPGLLPYWYDIDRPADLRWLQLHLTLLDEETRAPALERLLEELKEGKGRS